MHKGGPRISRTLVRVLILLSLSVFINYIDRANLSIAAPLLKAELGLSASQLGLLLSAFFWTYAFLQVPAGWLADRFEVKWVLATGFFLWTVATAATGLTHTFVALMAARIALGIGESVAYPAYSKIFSAYFVERQRGVANSAIGAGQALGPALGMLFGGALVARFGWRAFFIGLGIMSLIWLPLWARWMPRSVVPSRDAKRGPKFAEILRQRSSWGTCVGHFCSNYGLYFLLTWLPYYLVADRHFSLGRMSKVAGATFFCAGLSSIVCGRISDLWIASGTSPTRARKTFMAIGTISSGLLFAGCAAAPDSLFVVLLVLAGAAFGPVTSNLNAITQTLAGPLASGRWMGMQNFIANLSGAVAPALTGYLVDRTGHFYWPFLITAAVAWVGTLQWSFVVGAVEPVDWKTELRPISAGK